MEVRRPPCGKTVAVSTKKQNSSRWGKAQRPKRPSWFCQAPRSAILDFPKATVYLRFPQKMISRTIFRLVSVPLGMTLFLLSGCGVNDPRLAYGETQYLGGIYGNEGVSSAAPTDTISYWDGDGVSGGPSIKITL